MEQDPRTRSDAPARKKGGCLKSCCLVTVCCLALMVIALGVASYFLLSTPSNPVEKEYEAIPEYFDLSLSSGGEVLLTEVDGDA